MFVGILKLIIEFVMEVLETIVFVGSLFIVLYLYVVQPNQIKGSSMVPTFESNDYIFTSKVTYDFRTPSRGDIIVFRSLGNPNVEYIKRVIGLPGDTVSINSGEVFVNEKRLSENYISDKTQTTYDGFIKEKSPVTVPENQLFVLGDNRPGSSDSRDFGPVPMGNIVGTVFYRYFPPQKTGFMKNPLSQNHFIEDSLIGGYTALVHADH